MGRKGNLNDLMRVINRYAQGRASSVSLINNLIDFYFEDNKVIDISLHFLNEAVLHNNLRLFVRNFYRYEIKKRVKRRSFREDRLETLALEGTQGKNQNFQELKSEED